MERNLVPVHRNAVLAQLKRGEEWSGYMAPDKVGKHSIIGGWALGSKVAVRSVEDLYRHINAFAYHNCNYELGYRVKLWQLG